MANISAYLTQIRNSRYGSEMRAALANAIEAINTQVDTMDAAKYVDILEADYSALTPEEQMNGTLYFITDKGVIMRNGVSYGGGGGFGLMSNAGFSGNGVTGVVVGNGTSTPIT